MCFFVFPKKSIRPASTIYLLVIFVTKCCHVYVLIFNHWAEFFYGMLVCYLPSIFSGLSWLFDRRLAAVQRGKKTPA